MRTCGAHESVPDAGEPAGDQVRHFVRYAAGLLWQAYLRCFAAASVDAINTRARAMAMHKEWNERTGFTVYFFLHKPEGNDLNRANEWLHPTDVAF